MRKNSSNPQNLGPGPRPLIPEETVKLVKDMRRRLWRNRLKVAWREGKKRIIAVSIVIILYASLIGMMGMSGSREDDEETTEEETEEDDDAELSTVEGYMLVGVLLIGLYMLVWMGSFQAYMNIKKITNYTRIDVEHFYPSTIDRAALLRSNLRRAMLYAAVFALAVFLIFFPLAIER
ncbi:MAG: hypothetical protein KAU14_08240, partial [Thermoplasmata archaeon]|nr:hypothetical protein [Thermoplasmata archaeon]